MNDRANSFHSSALAEVYPLINSQHPFWPVLIYGIIFSFLTVFGILANLSVIFVTIRTKSFRGVANILLAFYSFFEIVNLSGNFLSIFSAFSGNYFMPFKNAFYFLLMPIAGGICAVNLMLFIGIERLFVVLFPLKKLRHKLFIAIVLKFILMCLIPYTFMYVKCVNKMGPIEIFVNYYEIGRFMGECTRFKLIGVIYIIITMIIYASIAMVLHCRRKDPSNANAAQFNQRILRSLFTIVCVNVGGYFIALISSFIFYQIITNQNALFVWQGNQIVGILLYISAASNAPILYWTSLEYREAFKTKFAFLSKIFCCCKRSAPTLP